MRFFIMQYVMFLRMTDIIKTELKRMPSVEI